MQIFQLKLDLDQYTPLGRVNQTVDAIQAIQINGVKLTWTRCSLKSFSITVITGI